MSVEAERTWLLILLQVVRMQADIRLSKIHGPGTGRIHTPR
jgi:hypothetical protein